MMQQQLPTRDEAITTIRAALKRRSGRAWSVTGGRGTAWGWITIDTMPARNKAGFGGEDRHQLLDLLGEPQHPWPDYVSIPAGSDYWQEYIDRAEGRTPTVRGHQYWD